MLAKVQPLKSEKHHIIPQHRHGQLSASKYSVKTVLFERCGAPEKQKLKDLMNPMEPCKTPETFILLETT